ncbi:P-loop containing nucleoside triphosphate hydrolase, partial [Sesbania bispinosa]
DFEVDELSTVSGQTGISGKSNTEPLSRFLQESMRSYYHSCYDKAEGSLWIHKYKPTKAFEVCGNDESLNFLRDWLHLWHERRYQSRKDSSNWDQRDTQNDDVYSCSDGDYSSKDLNKEDSLQNVLLITGPIGSGKSAAVYACAQEQGFDVLELNASDCRNGTAVKQYFGDALGSHGCKRLLEHSVSSQKKTVILPPAPALPNGKAVEEMDDGVIELITISNGGAHSPDGKSQMLHEKNNVFTCDSVQTLILVEDVDILFPEDRGCIAAIKHIAETAKGPIILTSNSNNGGLPENFVRLHIPFSLPLRDELLCHLYMVCDTEEVNINPLLLEKFIKSCDGDIRKTIMHVQFWFQNKKSRKDRKVQTVYGSLPFDLEAGHQILPKIIPWDFPSELSKLIEKEVSKSVIVMEENSCLQGLVEEELHKNEKQNNLDVQCKGTDYLEAKVEVKRNRSITDCSEFGQYSAISELANCSGSPVTSFWQKGQRKLIVMSSESVDKDPNNGHSLEGHDESFKRQSLEGNSVSSCKFQLNHCYTSSSFCKLACSSLEDSEEQRKYLGTAYDACLNETCKSSGISSFPESTIVPEIAIQNRVETMSGAVSSGHLASPVEVSLDNELTPFTFSVCQRIASLPQNLDSLVNTEIPESSPKAAVQVFRDENMETTTVYNMMNECSHADFKLKFVESSPSMEIDMVQNLWRKLCDCRTDLRQHATSEQLGAIQAVKLASGMTNLISEADFLFRNHQQKQCGIMEPPIFLSDEATFSWYNEQMMMSTVAVHGFCFYAKHISDVGSKLGCENRVDITSEMLASTTNIMALGKLSRQDHTKSMSNCSEKQSELKTPRNNMKRKYNENRTSLFNVIQSIVPARLSLAMKGVAFSEYLSSLRQISISEGFRITHGVKKMRKGRTRGAQHYLSRGSMLSPEDISLVCEGDLYRKISSQYTSNMEANVQD